MRKEAASYRRTCIAIAVLCSAVFGWRLQAAAEQRGSGGRLESRDDDQNDRPRQRRQGVEPDAGEWKTWVLASGQQFRLPPPPDRRETRNELDTLRAFADTRDAAALDAITYWDTGGPPYRWNEIARNLVVKYFGRDNGPNSRGLALVHVAIHDAMIAAWDSKYFYNRRRPSDASPHLSSALPVPQSPSYPSEFAAAAAAAASVLSYLFPQESGFLDAQAEAAGMSRLVAGVEYPSDVAAGMELGNRVAALVIEHARADNSDATWDGFIMPGQGLWRPAPGTTPAGITFPRWKPWVLSSPDQFRPGPPHRYDSPQKLAELAEVKTFPRTAFTNQAAYFWQNNGHPGGGYAYWNDQVSRKILEYGLGDNPPRAARAYALQSVTLYDSVIACWDAKYAYWAIRPFQLDALFQQAPALTTLFPTPNHPSYPGAHGCLSGGAAEMLGYLFPREAALLGGLAQEAANSRLWAGIHFRSDNEAGLTLGRAVAQAVIARAREDGSE